MDYIRYYDTQAAYNADTTRLNPSLSYIEATGEAVIDYTPIPPQIARVKKAEDFTGTTFMLPAEVISVDIPDDVTEIGTSAFSECSSLTEINLPSGVTTIGTAAFSKCTSLTSIDLPSGVTSIDQNAFKNCSSLESVTVRATTPPTVFTNSFESTPANMVIYVPSASVNAYKAATGWSDYASQIEAIPEPVPPTPSYPTDTIYYDANGTVVGTDSSAVLSGPPSGMLTDDVTRIVFGNVVTSIAQEAFDVSIDGSLDEIELGENITSIGEMAFFGEDTITKVTIHATTPPTIGPDLFGSTAYYPSQPFAIYVPAESVSAYQTAWSEYSQYITAIE